MQYFFFGGGGGGAARMSQPPVLCIPAFRLFFLTSSGSISPVSIPLRRGGEVPTSRTLHSRLAHALLFLGFLSPINLRRADVFPVVASLRRERGDNRKYVCASQAFAGYSPISPVSTAKFCEIFNSVSIWNQKCHFRKGANFGNQTLTGESKMKPKIRDVFKQRKQDKNQNKYQLLAFPCVEDYCKKIGLSH